MTLAFQSVTANTVSRILSVLSILVASVAVAYLLLPNPLADVFFGGIVLLSVVFAIVGGIGAWTNRTPLIWVAALLLAGLSILGMWSIGIFIAPAALLLLGAAVFSQLAGPREDIQKVIVADPPTKEEAAQMTKTGTGSMVVGAVLVYIGAFAHGLFGSCANETLSCALDKTHWGAVVLTIIGLIALSYGGWLLWKKFYISRVLAAKQRE